tara:strand:+ start:1041 stop:1598 length:558 start_codon:yes stop_codon:yes gene_type:complete
MYDNVIDKNIFPSFVCSCIPQIDMMSQLLEAYDIRQAYPSENMSNEGGYHSPIFTKEKFFLLRDVVEDFTNDLLEQKSLGGKVAKIEYWCNINKLYNYNVMHMHGRADLIGIYYIQTSTNSGDFVVMRNDGSQYSNLYENRADMLEYIIEPEPGRLYVLPGHLWHYVTASNSQKDRISVSFNIYL